MAGMFDDPEAGLLLGSRGDTAVSDPEAEAYLRLAAEFTPVFGDVMSAKDAFQALLKGDYSEAALAGLGVLPFVPGITRTFKPAADGFDLRYLGSTEPPNNLSKTRKADDTRRALNLSATVKDRKMADIPEVSLEQFEGRPALVTMSDRTAAGGVLTDINGVPLAYPVNLQGGQNFMFDNSGKAWAAEETAMKNLQEIAQRLKQVYGKEPLLMPWRMAGKGGDFATMTGETMLGYASAVMDKKTKSALNDEIKSKFIPDWKGVDNPESISQFRNISGEQRKKMQVLLDKYRDKGGLSLPEARLAISDANQVNASWGGLMNVAEMLTGAPLIPSGHYSYNTAIQGQGLGRLNKDYNAYELLPHTAKQRGLAEPRSPDNNDMRSLMMTTTLRTNPDKYATVITDKLLRQIENLRKTGLENPLLK